MRSSLLIVLVLAACADQTRTESTVIAAVMDQTTPASDTAWAQALELGIDHMNRALDKSGDALRFALRLRDSQGSESAAADDALSLVRESGAIAVVTDFTETARSIVTEFYAQDSGVPVQCSSCTTLKLTDAAWTSDDEPAQLAHRDPRGWLSRTIVDITPLTRAVHQRIAELGGDVDGNHTQKLAIYASDDDFGHETSDTIARSASGHPIVEQIFHRSGDPARVDYARDISRLLDDATESADGTSSQVDVAPDVIIVATNAQSHALFVEAFDAAASAVPVVHFYRFRQSSSLYQLGAIADGSQGVSYINTDGSPGDAFARDFYRTYGFAAPALAASYYDNVVTLMLGQLIATRDGMSLQLGLRRTSSKRPGAVAVWAGPTGLSYAIAALAAGQEIDYAGASGPVDFDAHGNVATRVVAFEVDNSAFVETQTIE